MRAERSEMPSRWNKLRQLRRFADEGKAFCLLHLCPFGPAFRFSARLGWLSRGAQTWQQLADPASHLLRAWLALLVFPRAQFSFDQIAGQYQMIVGNGNTMAPALKLRMSVRKRGVSHNSACLSKR